MNFREITVTDIPDLFAVRVVTREPGRAGFTRRLLADGRHWPATTAGWRVEPALVRSYSSNDA